MKDLLLMLYMSRNTWFWVNGSLECMTCSNDLLSLSISTYNDDSLSRGKVNRKELEEQVIRHSFYWSSNDRRQRHEHDTLKGLLGLPFISEHKNRSCFCSVSCSVIDVFLMEPFIWTWCKRWRRKRKEVKVKYHLLLPCSTCTVFILEMNVINMYCNMHGVVLVLGCCSCSWSFLPCLVVFDMTCFYSGCHWCLPSFSWITFSCSLITYKDQHVLLWESLLFMGLSLNCFFLWVW